MKAIIPAIDITGGRCVRLNQGNFNTKKVYNNDPVELAQQYFEWGARRIHIIDLDSAFKRGNNRALIGEICKVAPSGSIVEVGGGIRSATDIKTLLEMGVNRLCLGTVLVTDMFQVIHWTNKFGNIFIGSLDVKNGQVQVAGWQQDGDIKVEDLLAQLQQVKLCSIEYTNIEHDGMMNGPDLEYTAHIADVSNVPVVLSGGVSGPKDVDMVMNAPQENIVGMILGRSIFEGEVDLKELFKKYPSPDCLAW